MIKKHISKKLSDDSTDAIKLNFILDLGLSIDANDTVQDSKMKNYLLAKYKRLLDSQISLPSKKEESIKEKFNADSFKGKANKLSVEIDRLNEKYKNQLQDYLSSEKIKSKHNPKALNEILQKFSQENAFKYSTHVWDSGIDNYDDFIAKLNNEKNLISQINYLNRDFYQNVLYNFLYRSNIGKSKFYSWGENKLKIGWQFPPEMVALYRDAGKRPQGLRVPKDIGEGKRISYYGKLTYFEDYINIFKKEIEFRGDDFKEAVLNTFTASTEFQISDSDKNAFNSDIDFYTSTYNVKQALAIVYDNISGPNRKQFRNIKINVKCNDSETRLKLSITQIGSFSNKDINDRKIALDRKGSQLYKLRSLLLSFCDLSVESRFFIGEEQCYLRLNYLNSENRAFIEPIEESEVTGFTYNFEFYI